MTEIHPTAIINKNAKLADDISVGPYTVIDGDVEIGKGCEIHAHVFIANGARIGKNCKIQRHTLICEGVTIKDEAFVGNAVMFINDKYSRATADSGDLQTETDWEVVPTFIKRGAFIGSNATIMCGITIGEYSIIGAGSVATEDVPDRTIVAGNPAKVIRKLES